MEHTAIERATKMNSGIQQKTMTEATVRSLQQRSINKALESLDTVFDQNDSGGKSKSECFRGPFGVLLLSQEEHREPTRRAAPSKVSPRPVLPSPFAPNESDQPADLLNYFRSHIGTMALAVQTRGELCPWKAVHLPVAERTHKQLELGNEITCTEQSLYNSLLAASCYQHGQNCLPSTIPWVDRGNRYKEMARHQLELGIQDEVMSHGQNNYEELLMGLLSVALLEV